jgi:hypothetical protein
MSSGRSISVPHSLIGRRVDVRLTHRGGRRNRPQARHRHLARLG